MKSRSHLVGLNRVFKSFVELGVAEGLESVYEILVLREVILQRWKIRLQSINKRRGRNRLRKP